MGGLWDKRRSPHQRMWPRREWCDFASEIAKWLDIAAMSNHGREAVFLDRDGVIVRGELRNGKSYAPRTLKDFRLLPGARDAVGALHDRGFLVIVVTNQPDIGNGFIDAGVVEAMHKIIRRKLAVDAIELCPHRRTDDCSCRKPKPGMLLAAGNRLSVNFSKSYMIGDRCSDVIAGEAAGCYTIFIDRGYDICQDRSPDAVVNLCPRQSNTFYRGLIRLEIICYGAPFPLTSASVSPVTNLTTCSVSDVSSRPRSHARASPIKKCVM